MMRGMNTCIGLFFSLNFDPCFFFSFSSSVTVLVVVLIATRFAVCQHAVELIPMCIYVPCYQSFMVDTQL